MTGNIKEIPTDKSISVFQQRFDELKEDGWKVNDINKEDSGIYGEFAYKPAGEGVENPVIYLREIYHFTKKGGHNTCVVIEHKYDINGNIITSDYREYKDYTGRQMKGELESGNIPSIIDHGTLYELPEANSYNSAKQQVDEIVKMKQDEK